MAEIDVILTKPCKATPTRKCAAADRHADLGHLVDGYAVRPPDSDRHLLRRACGTRSVESRARPRATFEAISGEISASRSSKVLASCPLSTPFESFGPW